MVSLEKAILGSVAFAVFWVLVVFSSFPLLPIGRTAGSILGGLLMVVFGVLSPTGAYSSIDLQILGLLFGTMVVGKYPERANMFNYLAKFLSWKSIGPKDLLCRVCIVSALSSSLFTNDTSCTVLTEFVLQICSQQKLPPHPFLLALDSSANIGSAATPIGNPQNLVIAIESGMFTFLSFTLGMLPATLVGIVLNTIILLLMYWKLLSVPPLHDIIEGEITSTSLLEDAESVSASQDFSDMFNVELATDATVEEGSSGKWKGLVWKSCVYLITVGMLVVLLMGMNMSWTAIGAALAMIALDFKNASPCLEKVSYSILVFFCGMFISVQGFKNTGIPGLLWEHTEAYTKVNTASGIAILAVVILLLSNVVSNVPTVLLLGAKLATSAAAISTSDERKAWLILAWASTIAGIQIGPLRAYESIYYGPTSLSPMNKESPYKMVFGPDRQVQTSTCGGRLPTPVITRVKGEGFAQIPKTHEQIPRQESPQPPTEGTGRDGTRRDERSGRERGLPPCTNEP